MLNKITTGFWLPVLMVLCSYSSHYVFGQSKKYESVYANAYKNVEKNTYTSRLLSSSITIPEKNWNNYQGGAIHTTDSLFLFNNDLLCHSFPTNTSKISNDYLIFYFSQKNAKCPTLFSLLKYYHPILDKHLAQNNLPKEIQHIPVVCSAFNPTSSNGIGGEGFWHLNYPQGIKYGLTINEYIDERRDFEKSTKAATRYLKDLYEQYQNWELTLAAYSSGVVNVNKLLKRHNTSSYKVIAEYLPSETKDFVQAFVAMNYIYNYDSYGAVLLNPVIEVDTLFIERKLLFKAVSDIIKVKSKDFKYLNPSLHQEVFPNQFSAFFPKGTKEKFTKMKDSIYFYQDSILLKPKPKEPAIVIPKDGEPFEYTVRSGDVLGLIASRFNVRVADIQAWNNISGTRINIGQKLMIYGKKKQKNTAKKPSPSTKKTKKEPKETTKPEITFNSNKYSTYTVKSGDNLWVIAKKYAGVSADNIMEFNGIDANLNVGQVLKIPKP